MTSHLCIFSPFIQCTCGGLWDVKQMIFVHDYLKLMDKIWPLSALHLHHRRTSTNDRSRKAELLISSSSYHCTTILLSILQSHIIVYTVNHWKQFNKRIYLQMPISIFLQFVINKLMNRSSTVLDFFIKYMALMIFIFACRISQQT